MIGRAPKDLASPHRRRPTIRLESALRKSCAPVLFTLKIGEIELSARPDGRSHLSRMIRRPRIVRIKKRNRINQPNERGDSNISRRRWPRVHLTNDIHPLNEMWVEIDKFEVGGAWRLVIDDHHFPIESAFLVSD